VKVKYTFIIFSQTALKAYRI